MTTQSDTGIHNGADAGTLAERYARVKERIAAAAARAGRSNQEIVLVAVTKFAEPEQIRELIELGHRDFGENKVQQLVQRQAMVEEYVARMRMLSTTAKRASAQGLLPFVANTVGEGPQAGDRVRWHLIGHLQRNKVRKALEQTRLIHSVDSLRLAEEIQAAAMRRDLVSEILIEVNVSGEESKFGVPSPAALPLAEQIETMANVRVRGLMTMAPIVDNPEQARPVFARCRELFEDMRAAGIGEGRFNILSMGMSGDFEAAILEGANVVRVGSAIFGPGRAADDGDDEPREREGEEE